MQEIIISNSNIYKQQINWMTFNNSNLSIIWIITFIIAAIL